MEVSEYLNFYDIECKFYEDFVSIMLVCVLICYGVFLMLCVIVMEDL